MNVETMPSTQTLRGFSFQRNSGGVCGSSQHLSRLNREVRVSKDELGRGAPLGEGTDYAASFFFCGANRL